MKPAPFEYAAPERLDEALALLGHHGEEARPLAGGQSLVPLLALRLTRPAWLVDLNRLPGLDGVEEVGDRLVIGALARQAAVERSPLVRRCQPLLAEALRLVGHPAIRARGTIGGSLAHADPAAELPAVLRALGGELVLAGPGGRRVVPAAAFFRDLFTTALRPGELLVEVRLPVRAPRSGSAFLEVSRRHGDFALVGAAVVMEVDAQGVCTGARVALAGVAGTPMLVEDVAGLLAGGRLPPPALAELGRRVEATVRPPADLHASSEYRREVAAVLVQRAVALAYARALAAPEAPTRAERERGTSVAAAPSPPTPKEGARPPVAGPGEGVATAHPVRVTVNGRLHVRAVEARQTLADFLRDDLGLTGTHLGCEHGVCGACTIHVDGEPVRACLLLAVQADGASLRTVEGLAGPEGLSPLQAALREHHGLQCGFCTPGILMTLEAFLAEAHDPTEAQVREALAGNLCRCTGYQGIVAAALAVAAERCSRGEEAGR